jgi:HSP20 family protein
MAMATIRYEPWSVVSQLQSEINRMFGNLQDGESSSATAEWMPAVDIREFTDRFELLIDLPDVDPKAVDITLDNGVLTLAGERRDESDTVDTENVSATGRNGVLEISIAKHAKAQPRRITIK